MLLLSVCPLVINDKDCFYRRQILIELSQLVTSSYLLFPVFPTFRVEKFLQDYLTSFLHTEGITFVSHLKHVENVNVSQQSQRDLIALLTAEAPAH